MQDIRRILSTLFFYIGSYTIMAKPIKNLELHYPMIQFLIISDILEITSYIQINNNNKNKNKNNNKQFTCNFFPMNTLFCDLKS